MALGDWIGGSMRLRGFRFAEGMPLDLECYNDAELLEEMRSRTQRLIAFVNVHVTRGWEPWPRIRHSLTRVFILFPDLQDELTPEARAGLKLDPPTLTRIQGELVAPQTGDPPDPPMEFPESWSPVDGETPRVQSIQPEEESP